jgi:ribosomal protein S21
MIKRLSQNYLALSTAARARTADIKSREEEIASQEQAIRNLKRQMDDREAQLFEEAGEPKPGEKPPSVEVRKNRTSVAKQKDPVYLDLQGILEDAQRELGAMKAGLNEVLREHALDKRELDAIGGLSRAYAGTQDHPQESEPVAPSAPTAPATAEAFAADIF